MAPRANWKGYLKLSLVSCPIAMYPASSEREKIRFHNINSETGNRVRMRRVDEGTGEEVPREKIVSGYEGQYIEVTGEELEAIALESTRTIDIDEFVPKAEIDQLYNIRPYYIAPEGKVGVDAFAVIRDAIEETNKVALGRVVLTSREHVIALEPRGKGLMALCCVTHMRFATKMSILTTFRLARSRKICLILLSTLSREIRSFPARQIRRSLRRSVEGLAREETGRSEDHASQGAPAHQCRQLDGCPAEERRGRGRRSCTGNNETSRYRSQVVEENLHHKAQEGGMSFTASPPLERSRYFESGSPRNCHYCGQRFVGSAIRDRETNTYFCCDDCLKTAKLLRFSRFPRKAS
jgi:Ku protein